MIQKFFVAAQARRATFHAVIEDGGAEPGSITQCSPALLWSLDANRFGVKGFDCDGKIKVLRCRVPACILDRNREVDGRVCSFGGRRSTEHAGGAHR